MTKTQSEIIRRPGGVLLTICSCIDWFVDFWKQIQIPVCDLVLGDRYFTCLSLMCTSFFKQKIITFFYNSQAK